MAYISVYVKRFWVFRFPFDTNYLLRLMANLEGYQDQ